MCGFRFKLRHACELVENLRSSQKKVKGWYDRKAESFDPGDNLLVLLPIPSSSLRTCFNGPYVVQKKVGCRDFFFFFPFFFLLRNESVGVCCVGPTVWQPVLQLSNPSCPLWSCPVLNSVSPSLLVWLHCPVLKV